MLNSRLVEVLRTFSKEEIKDFERFLESPFFKKQRNLTPLFKLLKTDFPNFNDESLKKENLYKKLYGKEKYNDQIMRTLSSEMLKAAEDFLVQMRLRKNQTKYNEFLLQELFLRNLNNVFEMKTKNIEKGLYEKPPFDEQTIFDIYEIDNIKNSFYLQKNDYVTYSKSYIDYSDRFTVLSILKLLKSKDQFRLYLKDYNVTFDENLVDIFYNSIDFNKLLNEAEKLNHPYYHHFKIFYLLYNAHVTGSEDIYSDVKKEFFESIDKFGHEEKFHVFTQFEVFCIDKIHSGSREYYKELFNVYDLNLKNNAYTLTPEHNMNAMTYRNMLLTAVKVNDSVWLKNFIDEYAPKLSNEWKNNMHYFSYSFYYFETGDFLKALENINKIEYELCTFKADVKNTLLKIYYELDYFELALSTIDTYKHYISNTHEIPDEYRDYYRGFVKIYHELLKAKINKSQIEKKLLFKDDNSYPEKDWLMKKAQEITLV